MKFSNEASYVPGSSSRIRYSSSDHQLFGRDEVPFPVADLREPLRLAVTHVREAQRGLGTLAAP